MKPQHIALALIVAALWGLNFVAIKVGLRDVPPLLLSALRFLAVALPMVFLVGAPCIGWRWILGIGFVFGIAKFGLLFLGMDQGMPAGLSSLVLQSQAVFTMLFAALLLGERLRTAQVAGMVLATAGLILIGVERSQGTSVNGLLLVIAAAAAWGYANILMKQASAPRMLNLIVWVALVPPLPMAALSAVFEGPARIGLALSDLSLGSFLAIIYIAWGSTIAGFSIWLYLLRLYPASMVAPFSLMVPVFGFLASAVMLGEGLSVLEVAAGCLTLAGLLLVVRGPGVSIKVVPGVSRP